VFGAVAILAGTHLVRQTLSQCLSPLGFTVKEYSEPAGLLSQINRLAPELIVIDVDGLERVWRVFTAGLRGGEKAITVVLLASRFDLEDAHEALAAGVAGVILKPYAKENTRRLLELWLRRQGLRARRSAPRFRPPGELDSWLRYRTPAGWVSAPIRNLAEEGIAVDGAASEERLVPTATLRLGEAEATLSLFRAHSTEGVTGFRLVKVLDGRPGLARLLEQTQLRVFGAERKKGKW
jgi:CheY-like chemotaxis protein